MNRKELTINESYEIFDSHKREILERVMAGESAISIERHFTGCELGRVVRWSISRFNMNPVSIRSRLKAGKLAIAEGTAYYFSASTGIKRKIAHKLDWEFGGKIKDSELPLGEFQFWIFSNNLICISNASMHSNGGGVYKRIYNGEFDLDNYRKIIGDEIVGVIDPSNTAINIPPQEVAAQFGLIWFN